MTGAATAVTSTADCSVFGGPEYTLRGRPNSGGPDGVVRPGATAARISLPLARWVSRQAVKKLYATNDEAPHRVPTDELSAFVSHVRTEHIAVECGESALSEAIAEVLTASVEATGGPATYREEAPPSDGFDRVIGVLELAEITLPEGREVASWLRHYECRGEY